MRQLLNLHVSAIVKRIDLPNFLKRDILQLFRLFLLKNKVN